MALIKENRKWKCHNLNIKGLFTACKTKKSNRSVILSSSIHTVILILPNFTCIRSELAIQLSGHLELLLALLTSVAYTIDRRDLPECKVSFKDTADTGI